MTLFLLCTEFNNSYKSYVMKVLIYRQRGQPLILGINGVRIIYKAVYTNKNTCVVAIPPLTNQGSITVEFQ